MEEIVDVGEESVEVIELHEDEQENNDPRALAFTLFSRPVLN